MLGAKARARRYLDLIAPWAGNEWRREDFATEQAIATRMDPVHTVFPIPTRPMPGAIEALLLGREATDALERLLVWVQTFNTVRAKLDVTPLEHRMEMTILLHAGVIGTADLAGLHSAHKRCMSACSS